MRLTNQELEKILNGLRQLNPDIVKRIAPVVLHAKALQLEIYRLEAKIRGYEQPDLFHKQDKELRLWTWLNEGNHRAVNSYCNTHKIRKDVLIKEINEYAKKAGLPPIKGE